MSEARLRALVGELKSMAAAASRFDISAFLGKSDYADRDLYKSLGYLKSPNYDNYNEQYRRNPLARAVITRPVGESWSLIPEIRENDSEGKETPFELAWAELADKHALFAQFEKVDTLATLGQYAVILLGLKSSALGWGEVTSASELLYLTPFPEKTATIKDYETASDNPRFGMPTMYKIQVGAGSETQDKDVHWSRVIHVVEGALESPVKGGWGLEAAFNTLQDLQKVAGGSAEMFWRGGLPGLVANIDPDMDFAAADIEALTENLESYVHSLKRFLYGQGIKYETLAPNVADPRGQFEILLDSLAAASNTPKRILLGSERGELSSSQDAVAFAKHIDKRRRNYCERQILRPVIDRLIAFKVLPTPATGYVCDWPDLLSASDKEKADVSLVRANAWAAWANSVALQDEFPAKAWAAIIMNHTTEEIDEIIAEQGEQQVEADDDADLPVEIPEDADAV